MDHDRTSIVGDVYEQVFADEAHYLVVAVGPRKGYHVEVGFTPRIIGRSRDADVDLRDPGISGLHCRVRREAVNILVEDLRSTNGTYIDGQRVAGTGRLPPGSVLQVGGTVLRHEILGREEVAREEQLERELRRAAAYVRFLIPEPISEGPVRTSWRFVPSAHLGGDAFGYHRLGDDLFAVYLLDVCGHGVGAALHSVAVLNALSRQSLRGVSFRDPGAVLGALNEAFPMENHAEMYFTIFYGVYSTGDRRLAYASAGHPPGLLVPREGGGVRELAGRGFPAGMLPGASYRTETVRIPPGSRLYLASDGAFEIRTERGRELLLDEFRELVAAGPRGDLPEPERIEGEIRARMAGDEFEDDFSLLVLEFS